MDSNALKDVDTAAYSELQVEIQQQSKRRRTFAIISHVDFNSLWLCEGQLGSLGLKIVRLEQLQHCSPYEYTKQLPP